MSENARLREALNNAVLTMTGVLGHRCLHEFAEANGYESIDGLVITAHLRESIAKANEALSKAHNWGADGFCTVCHKTHRTDFRPNDLCKVKMRLTNQTT